MKNGTPFKALTLNEGRDNTDWEYCPSSGAEDSDARASDLPLASPAWIFVAVSMACAVAAIAAGSYALWLTRHKASQEALTNVQDILKVCQDRMHQLEEELYLLPSGLSPSS